MAHLVSWRSAAACLELGVDRTRVVNGKNVEIDRMRTQLSGSPVLRYGRTSPEIARVTRSMPADVQDAPQTPNELAQLMWPFAKRVGIVNGLLALLGIGIALYVYCEFPIPATIIHHRLDKFGQPVGPESALSYLFAFPIFQVWLAVMPLWGGWRAARIDAAEQARRDDAVSKAARNLVAWAKPMELSAGFLRSILVGLVIVEIGLLFVTIFHAVSAALGRV